MADLGRCRQQRGYLLVCGFTVLSLPGFAVFENPDVLLDASLISAGLGILVFLPIYFMTIHRTVATVREDVVQMAHGPVMHCYRSVDGGALCHAEIGGEKLTGYGDGLWKLIRSGRPLRARYLPRSKVIVTLAPLV